jgi:adenylosuccinate synthase
LVHLDVFFSKNGIFQQQADDSKEQEKVGKSLGTTIKGVITIGPTSSSKATRNGIRMEELLGMYMFLVKCIFPIYIMMRILL